MTANLSEANSTSTPLISSSERVTWVLIWYLGILPALWLAPAIYSWLKSSKRMCKCGFRQHESAPISTAAIVSLRSSSEAAKLEAAEQSRKRLHARVNGALWQAGVLPADALSDGHIPVSKHDPELGSGALKHYAESQKSMAQSQMP